MSPRTSAGFFIVDSKVFIEKYNVLYLMATYTLSITTTWSGSTAARPDLTRYGAIMYLITTGATQTAADNLMAAGDRSYRCYTCTGPSTATVLLNITATTVYATVMALRPLCSWSYTSAGKLVQNGTVNVSCKCTNLISGYKCVRNSYLSVLASDIDTPYAIKDKIANTSKTSYQTSSSSIPQTLAIDMKIARMSTNNTNYGPYPYSANRCISLKTMYFDTSKFKTANTYVAGIMTNYSIAFNVQINSGMGNLGSIEVYFAAGPNMYGSAADSSTMTYDSYYGLNDYGDLDINSDGLYVYAGVNLDYNPNGRTIGLGYSTIQATFPGYTLGEIQIPVSEISGSKTFYVTVY